MSAAVESRRLLVACDNVVVAGGLFRFDRLARVLRRNGHELCFVSLANDPIFFRTSDVPVLSLEVAAQERWDATMIPGAGFGEATIERFAALRADSFGIRVQHVLNDQGRRAGFLSVNRSFQPDLVIFNNTAWEPGSFVDFAADRFHILLGAVDCRQFKPALDRPVSDRWIIGGLANKNPMPLVEALERLGETFALHLYGADVHKLGQSCFHLVEQGRLRLFGELEESQLASFYDGVDCVAMTETMAGWANLAAEALASGLPLVCTRHGTAAFARHKETALVIETPTAETLASAIETLRWDEVLRTRLTCRGREVIEQFSWEAYAEELLSLIGQDHRRHYFLAPDLGLFGKWPIEHRLRGMRPLLDRAAGSTIVDFGAAEGIISRAFLDRGARLAHAFELDGTRVAKSVALCRDLAGYAGRQADLSDWEAFRRAQADHLLDEYDIVLFLGLYHHLPSSSRLTTLLNVARLARRFLAFRTPERFYVEDGLDDLFRGEGFRRVVANASETSVDGLGLCAIYERSEDC